MEQIISIVIGSVLATIGSIIAYLAKDASNNMKQNTHAIIKLEARLEHLSTIIGDLSRVKPDLDSAHSKIRNLESALERITSNKTHHKSN